MNGVLGRPLHYKPVAKYLNAFYSVNASEVTPIL